MRFLYLAPVCGKKNSPIASGGPHPLNHAAPGPPLFFSFKFYPNCHYWALLVCFFFFFAFTVFSDFILYSTWIGEFVMTALLSCLMFCKARQQICYRNKFCLDLTLELNRYPVALCISPSLFFHLFICSHNDSIQCVAYNPVTHQLASCSSGDFGECTMSLTLYRNFWNYFHKYINMFV